MSIAKDKTRYLMGRWRLNAGDLRLFELRSVDFILVRRIFHKFPAKCSALMEFPPHDIPSGMALPMD